MTREPCSRFEPMLARAADHSLAATERAELERHLSTCEPCRVALDDQRAVRARLQARPVLRAHPSFSAAVMARLDTESSWLDALDFRRWTWRLAPAAGALLAATWMFVAQPPGSDPAQTTTTTAAAEFSPDLPVSAALWQESVSDTSVLSLMLRASADDPLADAYKER
jgi:anti-sigma factor RsiW